MTTTKRIEVSTAPGRGLRTERVTPKFSRLVLPSKEQIFLWEGVPFAAFDGSYVYTYGRPTPAQLSQLDMWNNWARLSQSIDTFEWTLGQMLSKAGLMLVRRLDL